MSKRRRNRQRAMKRAAREAAKNDLPPGVGGVPPSPINDRLENQVIEKAVKAPRRTWDLNDRHRDAAIGVTVRNMASEDGRVSNGAVKNMISMAGQDQKEREIDKGVPAVAVGVQVNVNSGNGIPSDDELARMSDDELFRLHRQTLGLPAVTVNGREPPA